MTIRPAKSPHPVRIGERAATVVGIGSAQTSVQANMSCKLWLPWGETMAWRYVVGLTLSLTLCGCEAAFFLLGGFGPPKPGQTEKLQMATRTQGAVALTPEPVAAALGISGRISQTHVVSANVDGVLYQIALLDVVRSEGGPSRPSLVLSADRKGTTIYHAIVYSGRSGSARARNGESVVTLPGSLETEADFEIQRTFWLSRLACCLERPRLPWYFTGV
jgi:hypothetical protein